MAVHAIMATALLWSVTSGAFSGGAGGQAGDGSAVMVSLVGPLGGGREANERSAVAQAKLDALMQKERPDGTQAPDPSKPTNKTSLDQLFNEMAESRAASRARQADRAGEGDNGATSDSAKAAGVARQAKAVQGKADERGDNGHMSGDMWSQLQTCWKPDAAVPVTLEVVIDSSGGLALPPKIIRSSQAVLDERRLRAEAQAIQAVAQCAPFRSGAPLWGKRSYQFVFAPK